MRSQTLVPWVRGLFVCALLFSIWPTTCEGSGDGLGKWRMVFLRPIQWRNRSSIGGHSIGCLWIKLCSEIPRCFIGNVHEVGSKLFIVLLDVYGNLIGLMNMLASSYGRRRPYAALHSIRVVCSMYVMFELGAAMWMNNTWTFVWTLQWLKNVGNMHLHLWKSYARDNRLLW